MKGPGCVERQFHFIFSRRLSQGETELDNKDRIRSGKWLGRLRAQFYSVVRVFVCCVRNGIYTC